jgi:hypothetical protein
MAQDVAESCEPIGAEPRANLPGRLPVLVIRRDGLEHADANNIQGVNVHLRRNLTLKL